MWQFAEAVRGLADGCLELGVPVTGGNVSFYNQTGDDGDPPDARSSACSASSTTSRRRTPDGLRRRRATSSSCSARPATSSPARSGRTSCTATSAAARRSSTSGAERALAERPRRRRRRRQSSPPRTTSPTAAWRRRWSRWRCAADVGVQRRRCPRPRPVRRAVLRVDGARVVVVVRPADEAALRRALRRARRPGAPARHGRWRRRRGRRVSSRMPLDRAPDGLDRDASRAVRADRRLTADGPRRARSTSPTRSRPWTPSGRWLRAWIGALPRETYAVPSVLDGWTVGDLVAPRRAHPHALRGARAGAGLRPPLTIGGYVAAYAGVADVIRDGAVETAREHGGRPARRPRRRRGPSAGRCSMALVPGEVMGAMRGPIRSGDLVATRVLELVVHADDLARSLPDREPPAVDRGASALVVRAPARRSSSSRLPGTASRSGSRRSAPSSASRVPGTREARRRTSSRPTRRPGYGSRAGASAWAEAVADGSVRASGERADLAGLLPLL